MKNSDNFEIKSVSLEWLKPHPDNPRINQEAVEPVKRNILKYGLYHEIVAAPDGTIAIGHTRYEAVKQLGWKTVQVKIAKNLNKPSVIKALMIADNKSADFAKWDYEKLEKLIQELEQEDEELLKATLLSEEEIEAILDESIEELEAAYADTANEGQKQADRVTQKENLEVVQLFYTPEEKQEFIEMSEHLMQLSKINSLSELIQDLLKKAHEAS